MPENVERDEAISAAEIDEDQAIIREAAICKHPEHIIREVGVRIHE